MALLRKTRRSKVGDEKQVELNLTCDAGPINLPTRFPEATYVRGNDVRYPCYFKSMRFPLGFENNLIHIATHVQQLNARINEKESDVMRRERGAAIC